MTTTNHRIAPSILSADFARLGEEVKAVVAAGADWIHFDVMDNHYVPNLTIGPLVCEAIRPLVNVPIDVHLMVKPVDRIVPDFAKAGANVITFHPEASDHIDRTLSLIRESGCKAGLVFNPATPLTYMDHVMDKLDLVLLMSVNPGFGGQAFIGETLRKVTAARAKVDAYKKASGREILVEIDGGVKVDNIAEIARAGADTFVAGSAIFGARDANGGYAGVMRRLRDALADCMTARFKARAVLIDLDGTLVDSLPDIACAANSMREELGLPTLPVKQIASYVGKGVDVLVHRALTEHDGRSSAARRRSNAARQSFNRHYGEVNGNESRVYPGVQQALEELRGKGMPLACVTNKPRSFTLQLLRAHEFESGI